MTPAFWITIGGVAVTGNFNDRLLELSVTDNEGFESDTVTVKVDDRDGTLAIPETGALMAVGLGYKEASVPMMGLYTVDEVHIEGWPRTMTIKGRSAEVRDNFKTQQAFGYENKTLGQVVQDVASRQGLTAKVCPSIANFKYNYLAQTEESDLNFLSRLAKKHDALATVKNNTLIFCKKGEFPLGLVVLTHPGQFKKYDVRFQDRSRNKECRGAWWDQKEAKRKREKGQQTDGKANYEVPVLWPDGQSEAMEVADSKANALGRDEKVATFTIVGDPRIVAEMQLVVAGVRAGVDGMYRIKHAKHTLNNQGYETTISTELPKKGHKKK